MRLTVESPDPALKIESLVAPLSELAVTAAQFNTRHHLSTRVPCHPVWPRPVALLPRNNCPPFFMALPIDECATMLPQSHRPLGDAMKIGRLSQLACSRYILLASISFCWFQAKAQLSPQEQAMAQIINALQTGSENWARYSPQLQQVIAMQTNGTGIYLGLAQLGAPTGIHMQKVIPLPSGFYFIFRSDFNAGSLDWQVVADLASNLWGLQFQPANIQPNSPQKPVSSDDDDSDDDDRDLAAFEGFCTSRARNFPDKKTVDLSVWQCGAHQRRWAATIAARLRRAAGEIWMDRGL